jgi:hypothetical protein
MNTTYYYLICLLALTTPYNYSMMDEALNKAVRSGNTTLISDLIKMGANVNNNENIGSHGFITTPLSFNATPLAIALHKQDPLTVKCLLENGATVRSSELCWAINSTIRNTPKARANYHAIIKCLIDYGADVNATQGDGHFGSLDYALLFINPKIGIRVAQMLINSGADIHRLNPNNKTVLDRARNLSRPAAVNLINKYLELEQEIQSNITQETLTKAIELGYSSVVKLLLQRGMMPTQKQLKLAKTLKHREIGRLLIAYLGLSGPESLISTTGIRETVTQYALPKEITHTIASFLQSN